MRIIYFVEQSCEKWGILFEGTRIDVPAYMKQTGESSQVAARKLRYAFFGELMKKYECTILVLGHHGDDQIETMLMRLTQRSYRKGKSRDSFQASFSKWMYF